MWSDNETLSDCIDFTHLIGAVRRLIDNDALLPCSIGIFGDWGGGKSSLMVREQMIKDKQAAGINFAFDLNKATEVFHEINEELKEAFQLCALVAPILTVGLNGNPRQCKRFLNSLLLRVEMAKAKSVQLEKQVLAKLMLLEYFKPETFDTFYHIQAENEGKIPHLVTLEKAANSEGETDEATNEKLSAEEEAYLQDSWFKRWLTATPRLSGKDLHAYFYVSRDRLNKTVVSQSRMTPTACSLATGDVFNEFSFLGLFREISGVQHFRAFFCGIFY